MCINKETQQWSGPCERVVGELRTMESGATETTRQRNQENKHHVNQLNMSQHFNAKDSLVRTLYKIFVKGNLKPKAKGGGQVLAQYEKNCD
jgi:hypothetical protein